MKPLYTNGQGLSIYGVEAGPAATFGYIAIDEQEKVAAVVDSPFDSTDTLIQIAEQHKCIIQSIFLTHSHWDHTAETAEIQEKTGAKIYLHAADEHRLTQPMEHTVWQLPFEIRPASVDVYFHHGDTVESGRWKFSILHTPGHTEGGVCLVSRTQNIVFVGDTVFAGSIGRTDLPGGNTQQLLNSIHEHVMTLPGDMEFFPGHGPTSNIQHESESNPFLQKGFRG